MALKTNMIAATDKKSNSGRNTDRIINVNKSVCPLSVVPTANFTATNVEDACVAYPKWTLWFDNEAVAKFNEGKEDGDKIRQVVSFAQIHESDSSIDPGLWLQENAGTAFKDMVVPGSSMYDEDPEMPLRHADEYLIPVLWLSNPDLPKNTIPQEEHVLKFTQKTVAKGFRSVFDTWGKIDGVRTLISMEGNKYNVSPVPFNEEIPPRELDLDDYIANDDRDLIVSILAKYNIHVPAMPDGAVKTEDNQYLNAEEAAKK